MAKDRNILDHIIKYLPISIFLLVFIIDLITKGLTEEEYLFFYGREIEFLKIGLIPNLFFLATAIRYKLCYYNIVSIFGMILMNISALALIGWGTESAYEWYTIIVDNVLTTIIALLAIGLLIKKR